VLHPSMDAHESRGEVKQALVEPGCRVLRPFVARGSRIERRRNNQVFGLPRRSDLS